MTFHQPDNNSTTYTYYGQGEPGAGKVKSITNPHQKTQWFRYNQRGQKVMTWGLTDYPVLYEYDAFGELHKMHTTHVVPFANRLALNDPDPPTLQEWLDRFQTHITTWIRDPFTRQVIRKECNDGKGNNFVYSIDGKLIEETSARGAKKVREYDKQTGELAKITTTLDGETTETIYERDRMGNVVAITDGEGRRTFKRDEFGREIAEILPDGQRIERNYADDSGALAVVELLDLDGQNVYQTDYSYNPNGTLAMAEGNDGRFEYGYVEGAPQLLASMEGPAAKVSYAYEENRNLVTEVHNVARASLPANPGGARPISSFTYTNDEVGRRVEVAMAGENLENTGWQWGYNNRSELVSADPVNAELGTYSYQFNGLGNREAATEGHVTTAYQTNALNQYTAIEQAERERIALEYDLDGNLTRDENAVYTWDAKNQLVRVEEKSGVVATYQYDYMGRRTRKTVRQPNGSTTRSEFVYDGWNVIQETITSKDKEQSTKHSATRYYTWGRDLSGTLQGAGGVGGLLSIRIEDGDSQTELLYPSYDANGNITEVVDQNGTVRAAFQYGPFGNLISEAGDLAEHILFRFSTKYFDCETGFSFYGFRYFDPIFGRWLSRDRVGEHGGSNLYAFVGNSSPNEVDVLGNSSFTDVVNGEVFYTWHMGWLDIGHLYEDTRLSEYAHALRTSQPGSVVGGYLSMSQGIGAQGSFENAITSKTVHVDFCIRAGSDENSRIGQLLYVYQKLAEEFEEYQSEGPMSWEVSNVLAGLFTAHDDLRPSGFSGEDLMSDLISFYASVNGIPATYLVDQHAGKLDDTALDGTFDSTSTDAVGMTEQMISMYLWLGDETPNNWKNWFPDFKNWHSAASQLRGNSFKFGGKFGYASSKLESAWAHYNNSYGNPKFPTYFQQYTPISDGVSVGSFRVAGWH